jgi:hypothetical protein
MKKDPRITVGSEKDYEPTYSNSMPPVTAATSVERERGERHGAKQGILATQSEGPQGSQGRRPAPSAVETAKEVPGCHAECVKAQVGENRYPINKHVEEKRECGPNN